MRNPLPRFLLLIRQYLPLHWAQNGRNHTERLKNQRPLVSGDSSCEVPNDLGSLLHGEMDFIQVIQHPFHLFCLPMLGLSCLGSNLDGVLHNLRMQHRVSMPNLRGICQHVGCGVSSVIIIHLQLMWR